MHTLSGGAEMQIRQTPSSSALAHVSEQLEHWSAIGVQQLTKTRTEDGAEESSDDEERVREEDYSSWATYQEKS